MHEQFLHPQQCRRKKPGFIIPVSLLQHLPLRIDFTEYFCSDRFFAHVFLFFVIAAVFSVLKGFLHLRKLFNLILGSITCPSILHHSKTGTACSFGKYLSYRFQGFIFQQTSRIFGKIKSAYSFENSETTVLYALRISVVLDFAP